MSGNLICGCTVFGCGTPDTVDGTTGVREFADVYILHPARHFEITSHLFRMECEIITFVVPCHYQ